MSPNALIFANYWLSPGCFPPMIRTVAVIFGRSPSFSMLGNAVEMLIRAEINRATGYGGRGQDGFIERIGGKNNRLGADLDHRGRAAFIHGVKFAVGHHRRGPILIALAFEPFLPKDFSVVRIGAVQYAG